MRSLFLVIIMVTYIRGEDPGTIGCGKRGSHNDSFRIINGTLASKGEFPWLISLRIKDVVRDKHNCGGAIISDSWVLTAAHCVYNLKTESLLVVAGENNIIIEDGTEQARNVTQVLTHNFDLATFANDIALLKLEMPLEFGSGVYVMPICLPEKNQKFGAGNAVAAGWGSTENGLPSDLLHFIEIPLVNKSSCDYNYIRNGYSRLLNDCQICAGAPEGGRDACQGDSGGPLICEDNGKSKLCGIVSWGIGCGRKEYPGIYTKVSCYIDWIERTLQTVNH